MSTGMVRLRPVGTGSAAMATLANTAGTKLSSSFNPNVLVHSWQASGRSWKYAGGCLAFVFVAWVFTTLGPSLGPGMICVMVPVLLLGYFGVAFLWMLLVGIRLGTPELMASSNVVRRGDRLELEFRQPVRRGTTFSAVKFRLVLREWVRYRCGTKTCTDQRDNVMDEQVFAEENIGSGETLEKRLRFKIPDNAMHTFSASDNRLTWLIMVELEVSRFPDLKESFEITLTPEAL